MRIPRTTRWLIATIALCGACASSTGQDSSIPADAADDLSAITDADLTSCGEFFIWARYHFPGEAVRETCQPLRGEIETTYYWDGTCLDIRSSVVGVGVPEIAAGLLGDLRSRGVRILGQAFLRWPSPCDGGRDPCAYGLGYLTGMFVPQACEFEVVRIGRAGDVGAVRLAQPCDLIGVSGTTAPSPRVLELYARGRLRNMTVCQQGDDACVPDRMCP